MSTYVSDPLGSTIGLIDSAGTLTDRWTYWPYGEVATRTGTNPTPLTFIGVLGYFQDVLSKLFYVRARHLRVDLARWLTVDPLWPDQLAYEFDSDNPVLTSVPSGDLSVSVIPIVKSPSNDNSPMLVDPFIKVACSAGDWVDCASSCLAECRQCRLCVYAFGRVYYICWGPPCIKKKKSTV